MGPKNDGRYGYSESTLFLFKHHVKRFLRYCHNGNLETADKVGVLDCIRYRPPKQDFRKEILTEQEVRRLIDACETQRDRALIHTLYESGCRAGELLGLRIKDIQFDEYGCIALVKGKTGPRRIRLIDATPDLQLWVNMCPDRENQDAPLWPGRRKEGRSIGHKRLFRLLQNLAKQAGVRKHVHPHLFRHSRATHLASVLKEAQMREFFGWTKRSEVPSIYVHLSGRDVDRTLLEHRGIRFEEQVKEDGALRVAECPRCKFTNPAGAKFCNRCSMVLDKKEAQELDERLRLGEELQGLYTRFMSEHGQELNKQFFELPEAQRILLKLGYEKVGGG
jgi:integrase